MNVHLALADDPRTAGAGNAAGLRLGRLGDFIGFRLRRVQNLLSRDFAAATADSSMRSGLLSSLAIIEANPGISQTELAREVGQDKSVAVAIVDDLEASGWAIRGRSPVDRRRHALEITDQGKVRLAELFAILKKTERDVLGELSPAELLLLGELLDRMYAACTKDA